MLNDVYNTLQGLLKRNKFQFRNELPDLLKTGWTAITAILLLQEEETVGTGSYVGNGESSS